MNPDEPWIEGKNNDIFDMQYNAGSTNPGQRNIRWTSVKSYRHILSAKKKYGGAVLDGSDIQKGVGLARFATDPNLTCFFFSSFSQGTLRSNQTNV